MPVEVMHAVYVVEGAAEAIGKSGGLQDILAAMRTFPDNVELCATCCNAIWSLTVGGGQQYSVVFLFLFFFKIFIIFINKCCGTQGKQSSWLQVARQLSRHTLIYI